MAGSQSLPPQLLFSSFQSFADPERSYAGYCASHPPDWSGACADAWPGACSKVSEPFRSGQLRPERVGEDQGRGLVAGQAIARGEHFCKLQPPLAIHQYVTSQSVCKACAYCHKFLGSAASALKAPLEAAPGTHNLDELVDPAALQELEDPEWTLCQPVPCRDGCNATFCGLECEQRARLEGWHRVLCTDLPAEKRPVWGLFQRHAARYQEHFIMAAHVIAEIVCLVRHCGADLLEAMAFFTRYAKMSWLSMADIPSRSCTQAPPQRGHLSRLARVKRERREEIMTQSLEMLIVLLWERRFAELLTLDFYANLTGQFSLSNVWVQIEHPLSQKLRETAASDEQFRAKYRLLAAASAKAALQVVGEGEEETQGSSPDTGEGIKKELADGQEEGEDIWGLPRFEASGLYVCCALSNHSCLPNFNLHFEEGAFATMYALRDIREGEELHLAYVPPSSNLEERLVSLWRHWGFVCTCRRCQDELMVRASDPNSGSGGNAGLRLSASGASAAASLAGLRPESPAGVRAVAALTGAEPAQPAVFGPDPPPVESDEEDEESSEDESDEDGSDEAGAASSSGSSQEEMPSAGRWDLGGPLGPRGVPASVVGLERDLQRLAQVMSEP